MVRRNETPIFPAIQRQFSPLHIPFEGEYGKRIEITSKVTRTKQTRMDAWREIYPGCERPATALLDSWVWTVPASGYASFQ